MAVTGKCLGSSFVLYCTLQPSGHPLLQEGLLVYKGTILDTIVDLHPIAVPSLQVAVPSVSKK